MAEAVEINEAGAGERFALEVRAEKLRTMAGGEWKRRGDSDKVAVGKGGLTDNVLGRERLDVRGSLTETVGASRTTVAADQDTRVEGHLSVKAFADTTLMGGGIQEAHIGGEVVVAGMSDDMVIGAGNRTTAPMSLWTGGIIGADEMLGSCFNDGSLIEAFAVCFEREYKCGVHHVNTATFSGTMYATKAAAFKKYWRSTRGVKNTLPGSGKGSESSSSSPPPSASAASAVQQGSSAATGAGRAAHSGNRADGGGAVGVLGQTDDVNNAVTVAQTAPDIDNTHMANSADLLNETNELSNAGTIDEIADVDGYTTVEGANNLRADYLADDPAYSTVAEANDMRNQFQVQAVPQAQQDPPATAGAASPPPSTGGEDIYSSVGDLAPPLPERTEQRFYGTDNTPFFADVQPLPDGVDGVEDTLRVDSLDEAESTLTDIGEVGRLDEGRAEGPAADVGGVARVDDGVAEGPTTDIGGVARFDEDVAGGTLTEIDSVSRFDADVATQGSDTLAGADNAPAVLDEQAVVVNVHGDDVSLTPGADVSGQSAFQAAPDAGSQGGIADTSADLAAKASGDPTVTSPRGEAASEWAPSPGTSAGSSDDPAYSTVSDMVETRNQYLSGVDDAAENDELTFVKIDWSKAREPEPENADALRPYSEADMLRPYNGRTEPAPLPAGVDEPAPLPLGVDDPAADGIYSSLDSDRLGTGAMRPDAEVHDADFSRQAPDGQETIRVAMPREGTDEHRSWDGVLHLDAVDGDAFFKGDGNAELVITGEAGINLQRVENGLKPDDFEDMGDGLWKYKYADGNYTIQVDRVDWTSSDEAQAVQWARERHEARSMVQLDYPAAGTTVDGEPWDGVLHISSAEADKIMNSDGGRFVLHKDGQSVVTDMDDFELVSESTGFYHHKTANYNLQIDAPVAGVDELASVDELADAGAAATGADAPRTIRLDYPANYAAVNEDGSPVWDGVVHVSAEDFDEVMNKGGIFATYDGGEPVSVLGMDQFTLGDDGLYKYKYGNFKLQVDAVPTAGVDDVADATALKSAADAADISSLDEAATAPQVAAAPGPQPMRLETPQDPNWDGMYVVDQVQARDMVENGGVVNWTSPSGVEYNLSRSDFQEFPGNGYTHYIFEPDSGERGFVLEVVPNAGAGSSDAGDLAGDAARYAAGLDAADDTPPPLPPRNPGMVPEDGSPVGSFANGDTYQGDSKWIEDLDFSSDQDWYNGYQDYLDDFPEDYVAEMDRKKGDRNWLYSREPVVVRGPGPDGDPVRGSKGQLYKTKYNGPGQGVYGPLDTDVLDFVAGPRNYDAGSMSLMDSRPGAWPVDTTNAMDFNSSAMWSQAMPMESAWGTSEQGAAEALAQSTDIVSSADSIEEATALVDNAPMTTTLADAADAPMATVQGDELHVTGLDDHFAATPGERGGVTTADVNAPVEDLPVLRGEVEEAPPPVPVKQRNRIQAEETPPPIPVKQRHRVDVQVPAAGAGAADDAVDESPARYLMDAREDDLIYVQIDWSKSAQPQPADFPAPDLTRNKLAEMADVPYDGNPMIRATADDPMEYASIGYMPNPDPEVDPDVGPPLPPRRNEQAPVVQGAPPEIPRYTTEEGQLGASRTFNKQTGEWEYSDFNLWEQHQEGYRQNMGVSVDQVVDFDEAGRPIIERGNGQLFASKSDFYKTYPEIAAMRKNGELTSDETTLIFNAVNATGTIDGSEVNHAIKELQAQKAQQAQQAVNAQAQVTALDDVATLHDDLADVSRHMADANALNTPDAATALDETTGAWFDNMAQARGAGDMDDAKDFELRSVWIQGASTGDMDDAKDFENVSDWIKAAPADDLDDAKDFEDVSDWIGAGASPPTNPNSSEVNVPQGDALPANFDTEGALARLDQEIELQQQELARLMADPEADPSDVARVQAELGARSIAKSEIEAGRDPRPTLYGMAEYQRSLGGDPEVVAAYSDTAEYFGGAAGDFNHFDGTDVDTSELLTEWRSRIESHEDVIERMRSGPQHPENGAVEALYEVERAEAYEDVVAYARQAMIDVEAGRDPGPELMRHITALESRPFLDGENGAGEASILRAMYQEYVSLRLRG